MIFFIKTIMMYLIKDDFDDLYVVDVILRSFYCFYLVLLNCFRDKYITNSIKNLKFILNVTMFLTLTILATESFLLKNIEFVL
jgi:hypothetical protein